MNEDYKQTDLYALEQEIERFSKKFGDASTEVRPSDSDSIVDLIVGELSNLWLEVNGVITRDIRRRSKVKNGT